MPYEYARPPDEAESRIAAKLGALTPLHRHEIEALLKLESCSKSVSSGDVLLDTDHPFSSCVIVRKGWFISEFFGPVGNRAISQVHFPGDIIGFSNLPYDQSIFRVVARSNGEVCKVPRHKLVELFRGHGRLIGLLFCTALIEQKQREDRISLSPRSYSPARIAMFILQTLDRLKLMGNHSTDQFHCPLTQVDVGDLVSMTSVHVSRTMGQLERLRLIERHGSFIKVLNRERLCELSGYVDRFERLNVDWLPDA